MAQIVIPTYQRYNIKTMTLLKREGLTATLYVANEEEYAKYKENYPDEDIIIGVRGIRNQREFIQAQYPEGTIILSMDDDIEDYHHPRGLTMKEWILECATTLAGSKCGLLSFNPSSNKYFSAKYNFKEGRFLCCGMVHMFKCDHSITGTIDFVEDYDRSMKYLKKYGAILRCGEITFKTKFVASGGLSDQRTRETYSINVEQLLSAFPQDLYANVKKSGPFKGLPNIKIR